MNHAIENWPLIVAAIAVIGMAITFVVNFFQKPTPQQLDQVYQWLIYAVTEAEKAFGSNMGKLKLRYVYDMFLTKFDWLSRIISFEKFSELVDKALDEMKKILESNKKAQEYVGVEAKEGEDKEDSKEEASTPISAA